MRLWWAFLWDHFQSLDNWCGQLPEQKSEFRSFIFTPKMGVFWEKNLFLGNSRHFKFLHSLEVAIFYRLTSSLEFPSISGVWISTFLEFWKFSLFPPFWGTLRSKFSIFFDFFRCSQTRYRNFLSISFGMGVLEPARHWEDSRLSPHDFPHSRSAHGAVSHVRLLLRRRWYTEKVRVTQISRIRFIFKTWSYGMSEFTFPTKKSPPGACGAVSHARFLLRTRWYTEKMGVTQIPRIWFIFKTLSHGMLKFTFTTNR